MIFEKLKGSYGELTYRLIGILDINLLTSKFGDNAIDRFLDVKQFLTKSSYAHYMKEIKSTRKGSSYSIGLFVPLDIDNYNLYNKVPILLSEIKVKKLLKKFPYIFTDISKFSNWEEIEREFTSKQKD